MLDLSVIIISYNTRELTLACLRSLFANAGTLRLEVIVLDNASEDGSADAIEREFSQVRLIRCNENVGFAVGNNLAVGRAFGQHLLLLNPDTIVLDGAIETLYRFAKRQRGRDICGGRTLFPDRSLNPASCWARPTLWSLLCFATGLARVFQSSDMFNSEGYGGWRRDCVREVDIVSGCFLMVAKALWDELGGFDPSFYMYGEEADLCLRAKTFGSKCMICPDATIIHYGGASDRLRADKVVKLFTAKARLFAKTWSPSKAALGARLLAAWTLTRLVAFWCRARIDRGSIEPLDTFRVIWCRRHEWYAVLTVGEA